MSKKKTLLTILAVMLVCCIAVTGTLAFLTSESAAVTNTFIGGDPNLAQEFDLYEHKAIPQDNGSYALDSTTEVTSNSYTVIPSTDLPKDPTISITNKSSVPAYLYVEVVDGLGTNSGLSYAVDSTYWTKLDNVDGAKGGTVYYYSVVENGIVNNTNAPSTVPVLEDNKVSVGDTVSIGDGGIKLEFYGYLAQASAGDSPAAAYTACFKAA